MKKQLSQKELELFFEKLKTRFDLYAPKRCKGKGRFSDTDIIRYGKIEKFSDAEWEMKSTYSPKDIIFPVTQKLFSIEKQNLHIPQEKNSKPILVFLRPCDINGIDRLDQIFLINGNEPDYYYARLREKIRFALIECVEGYENCFCISMNSNKTDNWDLALSWNSETKDIFLEAKDDDLKKDLAPYGKDVDFVLRFPTKNSIKVETPVVEDMPKAMYSDPALWDEYKSRCIACGRCNTTCITCSCFTTTDVNEDAAPEKGERRRVWAACHIDKFTTMAGGHEFRKDNASRMRFKTFHKIYDYKKRFNKEHMCVGCGRCDDNCPEYISFSTIINKVSSRLKEIK